MCVMCTFVSFSLKTRQVAVLLVILPVNGTTETQSGQLIPLHCWRFWPIWNVRSWIHQSHLDAQWSGCIEEKVCWVSIRNNDMNHSWVCLEGGGSSFVFHDSLLKSFVGHLWRINWSIRLVKERLQQRNRHCGGFKSWKLCATLKHCGSDS